MWILTAVEATGRNAEHSPRFFASPRDPSDFDVFDFDYRLLGYVVRADPKYPRIPECPNSDLFLGSRRNEFSCYESVIDSVVAEQRIGGRFSDQEHDGFVYGDHL